MQVAEALHLAYIAQVRAALLALLTETDLPFDQPDEVTAAFDGTVLHVTYSANGIEVSEERF